MKLLCLVLSVMVLILSVRPCCAYYDCQTVQIQKAQVKNNSAASQEECQGCSPFFTCGSCVGFTIAKPAVHTIAPATEAPVRSYAPYRQLNIKDMDADIWQPPQLS